MVRKPGGVQVLRSANRENPFLGLITRSASYTTSFPIHLHVLYNIHDYANISRGNFRGYKDIWEAAINYMYHVNEKLVTLRTDIP